MKNNMDKQQKQHQIILDNNNFDTNEAGATFHIPPSFNSGLNNSNRELVDKN